MRHVCARVVLSCIVAAALACGGDRARDDEGMGGIDDMGDAPSASGEQPGGFTAAHITPQMVALGDSIFEGKAAGGICYTCHDPEGKGTQLGPDLTDQQWIHGDGSLDFIMQTVREGIPEPQQFQGPMPAFRASMTDEQIRAVSAYVYSMSHPDVGR